MLIQLLRTDSDNRNVLKTYETLKTISGIFPTGSVDILNPVFIVDYDENILPCNYLYCDTTNRFYYVSPPVLIDGRRIELHCTCDVLMSWRSNLMECPATVIRRERHNSDTGGTLIQDAKLPINSKNVYLDGVRLPLIPNSNYRNYFIAIQGG